MATEAEDCLVATDIAIADPSISDDEEATTRAASVSNVNLITRLRNMGCIFVKNLTGEPILVYTRSAPKRRLQSGGLRAGATAHGFQFALQFVMTELNSATTCSMVVDPPEPDAKRKSERVPVMGETFLSVRRFTKGDRNDPANWRWDCLDMLVRPGQKITIKGTAVPLQVLVGPGGGGAAKR
ncbi:hypothetical protein PLESTB_000941800 [Pleodorina starrii]|uniref:Uncharacterized protein n=1 Tax=Pleodorina starrii TaxID=330485 RepID=A0A9W6BN01_9CHLO|nr:hypothetical protein PLESTM_000703000 [Pleodorina starrii]GLC55084.1 hypothetical protein PLESTB_000941800 [Pleodorina starrii]GLC71159.1 hypothetical protein PLESTF_001080900 [Pleodorina starrii]